MIISPTLLKEPNTPEKQLLEQIAKKYSNVTFLDFTANTTYNNQYNKFADEFHLNKQGATEFSHQLAAYLSRQF